MPSMPTLLVPPFALSAHPGRNGLAHALLEGEAEGAVTAEAAVSGQLLGSDRLMGSGSLMIPTDEVVDTEIVNISIISGALTGEILAEIRAVSTDRLSELENGQVVL